MRIFIICLALLSLAACDQQNYNTVSPDSIDTTIRPRVELITPLENAILGHGIHQIQAYALHYAGIKYVQFKFGTKKTVTDYQEPFETEWFITLGGDEPVIEGNYEICALAVDNTGCANSHCITVKVEY
jgi:hypothetical protein